jgi:hypothetical protein
VVNWTKVCLALAFRIVSPDARVRLYNLALARVKSSRFQPSKDEWMRMTPLRSPKTAVHVGVLTSRFLVGNILSGRKSDVAKCLALAMFTHIRWASEMCKWRENDLQPRSKQEQEGQTKPH